MIQADCSEAEWSFFTSKWSNYKRFYKLAVREDVFTELRGCCLTYLQYKLFAAAWGTDQTMEEVELLIEIKRLAMPLGAGILSWVLAWRTIEEERKTC